MRTRRLVIVGGGPAGLAAAISAYDAGERDILILEREPNLGGILNQCIHNGFGLHTFKEELTGPEYADRYIEEVYKRNIEYHLNTTVISITKDRILSYANVDGYTKIKAEAIILACGCRERARGAIEIPGTRPAGIFSAGTAQKLVNIDGYLPGKEVVILGSGDIGLIMARRMTYEGAKVKAVVELMPYSSGLNRNIVQCLNDYEIPLFFSHTIIDIKGRERISSVVIAQVDKNLKPILETAQEIKCDTLLLSVGLIPENELAKMAGVTLSSLTGGAIVDEKMMTNVEGIFACGNVLHVHDLVDFVSTESEETGLAAVAFLNDLKEETYFIEVKTQNGVRYTVPQKINKDDNFTPLTLKMRVSGVYRKVAIKLNLDGEDIYTKKKQIVSPGEMETINLSSELVQKIKLGHDLIVELEESE
jgi:NADPH-dependent 2,4-dienoyl-CoA reductase/sulfur reductase-like enzyme